VLIVFLTAFLSGKADNWTHSPSVSEIDFDKELDDKALNLINLMLTSDQVTNIEKTHCYVFLSQFYLLHENYKEYKEVMKRLEILCLTYPECDSELWTHYEYSFFH
jgi:hypothetical protein